VVTITEHGELLRRKQTQTKKYYFILFSDVLVWVSTSSYKFKGLMYLTGAAVYNFQPDPLSFELLDGDKNAYVELLFGHVAVVCLWCSVQCVCVCACVCV